MGDDAENVIKQFWTHDDNGFYQLPAVGRSGGLLCVWRRSSFNATNAFAGSSFLIVEGFCLGGHTKMLFLNVYNPYNDTTRRILWKDLLEAHSNSNGCWCLMGDFNVVRNASERKGSIFHQRRGADFNEFIATADLQELKLGGRRFTWIGMSGTKLSKLDRFLISSSLLNDWPQLSVVVLERSFADHCPLLLKSSSPDFGPIPFRLFDHWTTESGFDDLINKNWVSHEDRGNPMLHLKSQLKFLKCQIKL